MFPETNLVWTVRQAIGGSAMRCSKCGTDNREGAHFCDKCGAKFSLRCASCGAENRKDAKFCDSCGASFETDATVAAQAAKGDDSRIRVTETPATEILEGERKTITALFADIKGSMELIEDLDPEDARAIVDPALKLMMGAAQRYGGYVAQSTGDGIFALFGAPVAHEDHPQRALYAALRMQEELKRYSDRIRTEGRVPIQARVGVNTGEVVVRSITTGEGRTEYVPVGHSTGIAARMQALAPVGSIAATEPIRKLCEGYFLFRSLGPTRVKGVSEPIDVYEVTGLGPLRTRLQRAAARGYTKFVGRQREMEAMNAAAEQARAGHGQIVAAMAEPGVGKSRLLFEFKARNPSGWRVLEAYSVSYGKASAYLPVLHLLHGYFKIVGEDDERTRRGKVAGRLSMLDPSLEDTKPYLFSLLGIVEGADMLAQMDGQLKKRRTLEAIKRILLRESLNQPLMLVFEDLHWIDEQTQEFLNLLVDSTANSKILLLVNYRPEYSHQWGSKTFYTQLRLDPLGQGSAGEMLSTLLGDGAELIPLKRLIIEKTEGTPFFMEETVQVLFDEGALVRNGAVHLTKALAELKIPPTVQAILASRIDRLPSDAKDLLQTLAVMGREFSLSLIRAVVLKSEDELKRILDDLQLGEFIYEQPAVGDTGYVFKHALTQEVSYNSLLLQRRREIHQRVGEAIEILNQSHIEEHLSELASHYKQARNAAKAVHFLHRAANQSAARSALSEAEAQLRDAIAQVPALPTLAERDLIELGLQTTLGAVLTGRSYGAQEKEKPLQRACELCDRVTDPGAVVSALFQIVQFYISRMRMNEARALAERATGLVPTIEGPLHGIAAWHNLGEILFWVGEPLSVCTHADRAFPLYEEIPSPALIGYFGLDWWIIAAWLAGVSRLILGSVDQALDWGARIVERVRDSAHPLTKAEGLMLAVWPATFCLRDLDWIRGLLAPARQLAEEYGLAEMLGWCLQLDAYARFWQGERSAGLEQMLHAIARLDDVRSGQASTWRLAMLAEMYLELGDYEAAEETITGTISLVNRTDERFCEPEIYRIAGEIIFRKPAGDLVAAEGRFREAIKVAQKQSAKWWELRASKSLARLLRDTSRREDARTMLAEIYNWFTEGFDTTDLKDARALLDELSA
jgi:class 3 adenylate cyclase/tetratricopeptide (TPR) repeat protein